MCELAYNFKSPITLFYLVHQSCRQAVRSLIYSSFLPKTRTAKACTTKYFPYCHLRNPCNLLTLCYSSERRNSGSRSRSTQQHSITPPQQQQLVPRCSASPLCITLCSLRLQISTRLGFRSTTFPRCFTHPIIHNNT